MPIHVAKKWRFHNLFFGLIFYSFWAMSFPVANADASTIRLVVSQGDKLNNSTSNVERINSAPGLSNNGDAIFRGLFDRDHAMYISEGGKTNVVLQAGRAAPGLDGTTIDNFQMFPSINDSGTGAVVTTIVGPPGVGRSTAFYRVTPNGSVPVLAPGFSLPDGSSVAANSNFLASAGIDNQDNILMGFGTGQFPNPPSLYLISDTPISVARQGESAGLMPGEFRGFGNSTYIDQKGALAFYSNTLDPDSAGIFLRSEEGLLSLIAKNDDPVAGGGIIRGITGQTPIANGRGEVLFTGLVTPESSSSSFYSILKGGNGTPEIIYTDGATIGDTDLSVDHVFQYTFSDSGITAMLVRLAGEGVLPKNEKAIIYTKGGNRFNFAIREGEELPISNGDNRQVTNLLMSAFSMNDLGQLAFQATMMGPDGPTSSGATTGIYMVDLDVVPLGNSALLFVSGLISFGLLRRKVRA